jgi:DNA repair protein RadC
MKISTSQKAFEILKKHLTNDVEEVWCLALGPKMHLLAVEMIFRGTVDYCPLYPRDIFRFACRTNASHLIISHNHPSGDCTPSQQDLQLTQRMFTLSHLLEIPLVDHIIVGKGEFLSLADKYPHFFRALFLNH